MSAGTRRRQTRSTHRPFRTDRRDPTDWRSWRRTPVFIGDVAAHVENPRWTVFVTGVLPRGYVEIVTVERLREALVGVDGLEDIQEALRDGRILPRAVRREKLSPLTHGLADEVLDYDDGESGEVSA